MMRYMYIYMYRYLLIEILDPKAPGSRTLGLCGEKRPLVDEEVKRQWRRILVALRTHVPSTQKDRNYDDSGGGEAESKLGIPNP